MSLVSLAGATAACAYLDAKYHISKDLRGLWGLKAGEFNYAKQVKLNRQSLFYPFEEQVNRMPASEEAIWAKTSDRNPRIERLTWRQTMDGACAYGNFLRNECGVQPGELVAFYLQNSLEFMLAFLGTWAIGTAPLFLNYNLAGDALVHCVRVGKAKVLLVDEDSQLRARVEDVRDKLEKELGVRIIVLDSALRRKIVSGDKSRPPDGLRANVGGMDPMMVIFTSGTTGLPKAVSFHVMRAWGSVSGRIKNIGIYPGPGGSTWYDCMPLYHGTGANVAVMCMLCGVRLAIGRKFSVSSFWDDIRESDSTAFVYVGEAVRYLLNAPPSPRDKDHKVETIFGNGLRPDVWRKFMDRFGVERVSEFFNSSEGVFSLINVARSPFFDTAVGHHGGLFRLLLHRTYVPVEVDHGTNEIVRDPATGFARRLTYDEGGEIIVKVPDESAFIGYLNNESATAKKFARDVFAKGDLWYRSGDALKRDGEGRWFFLDRLGDTFRWKSENVSTAEVAIVMGQYPDVVESNVYGVLVPKHDGRAGCAAVYINPDKLASFDYADFLKFMRQRLPRYAVPIFLRVLTDMNPMHNQKQNKVPLRNEGIDIEKIANGHSAGDQMMWLPSGGSKYVPFGQEQYDQIMAGKAKL